MLEKITSILLIAIALGTISLVGYYLIRSVINSQGQKLPTRITYDKEVYRSAYGSLRFAQGECGSNEECSPRGYSHETCSSESELLTTYADSDDFPDKNIYECGCFDNRCAWIEK